jgi:hypothetical protein
LKRKKAALSAGRIAFTIPLGWPAPAHRRWILSEPAPYPDPKSNHQESQTMAPKVLISDKLSETAVEIFKLAGIDVDL